MNLEEMKAYIGNNVYLGHSLTLISNEVEFHIANLEKFGITSRNFDFENLAMLCDIYLSKDRSYITVQMRDGTKKEVEINATNTTIII